MKQYIFNKYLNLLKKLSRGRRFGKHPIFRPILKKLHQYLKPDFIIIQNQKIFLDPKDSLQLSLNGIYGKLETEIVKNEIKPNDVVIDCGAHIGYFTLLFAMLVGPTGKVFSFEPEPKNFELLKKNVEINNYNNVTTECKVVSDQNKKCTLYTFETSSGANRIYKPNNDLNPKPIEVDSISLDEYFKNSEFLKKIKFIKIDVEGAEILILKSMKSIFKENDDIKLLLEFNPKFLSEIGSTLSDFFDILYSENFSIFLIDNKNNKLIPLDFGTELDPKLFENDLINFFCKKII
jgi:FkbM family methyltransferase